MTEDIYRKFVGKVVRITSGPFEGQEGMAGPFDSTAIGVTFPDRKEYIWFDVGMVEIVGQGVPA